MATKSQKEKTLAQQEKGQAILSRLLKDDDNKYCVDCDAKGPRWASWNLGIFLCIRCAGIHRNLGAHISKVKSVNLDTWTPEQISMMMEIGNSRARAVYEANIPDGFRRPQTDSSLEALIRSKYEHKKYIAREWIAPTPRVPREFLEDDTKEKKRIRKNPSSMIQLNSQSNMIQTQTTKHPNARVTNGDLKPSGSAPSKLSDMDKPVTAKKETSSSVDDLLGLAMPENQPDSISTANFLGEIFNQVPPISASTSAPVNNVTSATTSEVKVSEEITFDDPAQSKSTKDSIMALYGSSSNPPPSQSFGYMGMNSVQYAQTNPAQYGQMNINPAQYGQINTNPGQFGQVNVNPSQYGQINTNPAQFTNVQHTGQLSVQQMNMMNAAQMGMGQMGMGQMGMYGGGGGIQQPAAFIPQQGMYNGAGGNMYSNTPAAMQQFQYSQVQQQMAGMSLGSSGMPQQMGHPMNLQPWQQQQSSTLSNNLWQ